MKIPLSKRLQACCDFIRPGDRVADIGCDHGYLGIYLLINHIAKSVIAADINRQPLDSAVRNAVKFGVREQMQFYLSDGARNIPKEFDVMVCAGMGADTIVSILGAATWLRQSQYRLVLQCQSKTPALRRYLSQTGWHIAEESVLKDGRFLYTVMEVIWQPDAPRLSVGQCYFPPAILQKPSQHLLEYYNWVCEGLRISIVHQHDQEKQQALAELELLACDPRQLI